MKLSNSSFFRIYYEDTDFSGFVYHANYLKFFERSREHLIGIDLLKDLWQRGIHFVVRRAELDYISPARFADEIIIKSEAVFTTSPKVIFTQKAFLKDGKELVNGIIEIVLLNDKNKPMRISPALLDEFQNSHSGS